MPAISDKALLKERAALGLEDAHYLGVSIIGVGQDEKFPRALDETKPIYDWISAERPLRIPEWAKWLRFWSSPRFTAKSTIVAVWLAQEIIKNPDVAIIIHGNLKNDAADIVKLIRDWLSLPEIVKLYGSFFKGKVGGDEEFTVSQRRQPRKDPTVRALGLDVPMAGKHPDIIVWDDLLGETNNTRDGIAKVERRIAASMPVLRNGGTGLYICTRWAESDPASAGQTVLDQPGILKRWKLDKTWDAPGVRGFFGAYAIEGDERFFPHAEVGKPLFPSVLPEEELERLRSTIPYSLYSSQYLNDPIPADSRYFEIDNFQYFDLQDPEDETLENPLLQGALTFMAIDPAGGKETLKRGDETAMAVARIKWVVNLVSCFVVEWVGGRWRPDEVVNRFFNLTEKWKPRKIFAEVNVGREWFLNPLRQRAQELGLHLPMDEIFQTGHNKVSGIPGLKVQEDRIAALSTAYAYKQIWHARSLKGCKGEDQAIRWTPEGKEHDDWIDVLAILFLNATKRKWGSRGKKSPKVGSVGMGKKVGRYRYARV